MIGTVGTTMGLAATAVRTGLRGLADGDAPDDFLGLAAIPGPPPAPPQRSVKPEQRPVDTGAKLREALEAFRKESTLTPAERTRREVLKAMDLTEEAIEAMPPEKRAAIEEKIAEEVARRMGGGRVKTPA